MRISPEPTLSWPDCIPDSKYSEPTGQIALARGPLPQPRNLASFGRQTDKGNKSSCQGHQYRIFRGSIRFRHGSQPRTIRYAVSDTFPQQATGSI